MNKSTRPQQRLLMSVLLSTLMLVIAPLVLITDAYAQQEYSEPTQLGEAELAQMLAPVALYPDSLLTHILIASTYPLEVVQASRWRAANSHLDADLAIQKARGKNWDPSVTALLAFPNILNKLSEDLSWTQKLGDAFLQDEAALLATIQLLRQQADEAGSLSEMEYLSVTRVDHQIIIESVQKEIIYVPYYEPLIVYGHWHWYSHPPVYWTAHRYYTPRRHSYFYWSSAVPITFNYYFSTFNWSKQHIVVVNHDNSGRYRHREQIISSHSAQRWHYKPQHRQLRKDNYLQVHDKIQHPSRLPSNHTRQPIIERKSSDSKQQRQQLRRPDKQQIGNRELQFRQKRPPAAYLPDKPAEMPGQMKNDKISHNSDKSGQKREPKKLPAERHNQKEQFKGIKSENR